MNLKRIAAMITTIGLSLTLVSCTEDAPKNPLEQAMKALTASEMKGRMTGTEGNAKAQTWIEDQFKTLGLTPLTANSFAVPYNHMFYDPDKQHIALEAIYSNERRSSFKHGTSFIAELTWNIARMPGLAIICPFRMITTRALQYPMMIWKSFIRAKIRRKISTMRIWSN